MLSSGSFFLNPECHAISVFLRKVSNVEACLELRAEARAQFPHKTQSFAGKYSLPACCSASLAKHFPTSIDRFDLSVLNQFKGLDSIYEFPSNRILDLGQLYQKTTQQLQFMAQMS